MLAPEARCHSLMLELGVRFLLRVYDKLPSVFGRREPNGPPRVLDGRGTLGGSRRGSQRVRKGLGRIEGSWFARSGAAFRESVAPMFDASRIGMVDS